MNRQTRIAHAPAPRSQQRSVSKLVLKRKFPLCRIEVFADLLVECLGVSPQPDIDENCEVASASQVLGHPIIFLVARGFAEKLSNEA